MHKVDLSKLSEFDRQRLITLFVAEHEHPERSTQGAVAKVSQYVRSGQDYRFLADGSFVPRMNEIVTWWNDTLDAHGRHRRVIEFKFAAKVFY